MRVMTESEPYTRVSLNKYTEGEQSKTDSKYKQKNQFGFMHEIIALIEK